MADQIAALRDHYILCGYGRVGSTVARELLHGGQRVVVIDVEPSSLDRAHRDGHLVVEGGPHGIRVNAVSPAMTETPHTSPMLRDPDGPSEQILSRVPLRKWGQAQDVANAILFLASDEASHVTGANIPVDGGAAVVG